VNEPFLYPAGRYLERRPQWCYCLIFLLLIAAPSFAKERAFRVLDQTAGLPVSPLSGFAQDTNGFFWFATAAGLYRFDGMEFRHWAKDKVGAPFFQVYAGPNSEVLVTRMPENTLYRVLDNEDVEIVNGPDGKPFHHIHDVAFTREGRLWVSQLDALFYRNDRQQWVEMPKEICGDERIWKLSASFDGSLWVATTHNIWKIDPNLSYRKILTRNFEGYIGNVVAHPDGSFFYMEKYPPGGKIFQWHDGQITECVSLKTNLHDLILRGETVWASGDSYLIALRSNRKPEILHAGKDEPIGGNLLVDNEGSLWMGDGRQLFQLPEPETEIWTAREGLPDLGIIDLHETTEGIWVSTWRGLGHLGRGADDEWRAYDDHLTHKGEMCSDGQGSLWLYDFRDFLQRWQGRFVRYRQPTPGWANGCDRGHDGRVWIATTRGLWRTQPGQSQPVLVSHPLGDNDLGAVFEDSKGRLWLTRNGDICHTRAETIDAGHSVEWFCDTIEGATSISKPIELPDGSLWAGTNMQGVWRYAEGTGWQSIPASRQLVSMSARLVPSPSGGVWVLGLATRLRVLPRPDLPEGWQVVEQLSNLQGIPPTSVSDLIEEADGSLWLTAGNGLAHLPASVRYSKLLPPRVKVVALLINGKRVDTSAPPEVPAGHNQIELQFAALSYRDRSLLKYQYRLRSNDEWMDSASNVPVFRFFDLRPGEYSVEVRASLDGVHWTSEPMRLAFTVLPPLYLRWWFIALVVLLLATSFYAAHRTRVAFLLGLERQRTRIAMDLHDQIGSGLGSIGILSSVAASQTISHNQREEMTKRITETADELGASLTDIVWSLRTEAITIETLAFHLTRRAGSLFADDNTRFITEFPDDWPSINLSLAAKRNVLLIAMESLHNAAKYARAEKVTLHFGPVDGRNWLMRIADDGCGLSNDASDSGSGMGMQTMQRRAKEIGAKLSITSLDGRGTIVSLVFNPQAKEHG